MVPTSVIITSSNESETIGAAISQILNTNADYLDDIEIIVVAPDSETLKAAQTEFQKHEKFTNYLLLKDSGNGKPAAINLAMERISGNSRIAIFTDGDMYIDSNATPLLIKRLEKPSVAGVSGRPISLDNRETFWGFSSHLFCHGAHLARLKKGLSPITFVPMSGYLYAIKLTSDIKEIFPIPENLRSEDAYITNKITGFGYKIDYEPEALAYVHFPKNLKDWILQKKRSLGGNIQKIAHRKAGSHKTFRKSPRNFLQDLSYFWLPLKLASNPKEYIFALVIYPLRLYLWIIIYIQHLTNSYSKGTWERIESSKR